MTAHPGRRRARRVLNSLIKLFTGQSRVVLLVINSHRGQGLKVAGIQVYGNPLNYLRNTLFFIRLLIRVG